MIYNDLTILYVEDDDILRVQYEEFFQRRCSILLTARDGQEAIEVFDNHHIDLIITDIRMPNVDGIKLIKYIRTKNKDVQIIVTSAFNDSEYLLKTINEGVSRYILKPFNRNSLKETLDDAINHINTKKENILQKRKLDLIIDNISSSIFLVDYNMKIVKTNLAAKQDFKINELDEISILDVIKCNDCQFKNILTKEIFDDKKIEDIELNISNLINQEMVVKLSCFLLEEENLILITIKNVTTLVKYENLIKKYVQTIDKHILSLRVNSDFTIIYASNAFCDYIHAHQSEIVGKNLHHFIEDKELLNQIPSNILEDKEIKYEMKIINSNKESKWVEVIFSNLSIYNSDIGYSIIIQDTNDKKELQNAVIKDSLTNLYNRRFFNQIKIDFVNSAKRSDDFVSFCVLDIDDFKLYNDNYGHQKGDNVIIQVSDVLKNNLKRANDYPFRIGGEEFILLFRTEDQNNAKILCKRILEEIENLKIPHKSSSRGYLTVSIGMYTLQSKDVIDIDDMFSHADDLLYKAKANGKNICFSNIN